MKEEEEEEGNNINNAAAAACIQLNNWTSYILKWATVTYTRAARAHTRAQTHTQTYNNGIIAQLDVKNKWKTSFMLLQFGLIADSNNAYLNCCFVCESCDMLTHKNQSGALHTI